MEFTLNGVTYHAVKIPAMQQFHIVRRMLPLLSGTAPDKARAATQNFLTGSQETGNPQGSAALVALMDGLAKLSDTDSEFILMGLLSAIRRKEPGGLGFAPVAVNGQLMYQTLTLPDMMQLAVKALMHNLSDFSAALPQASASASPTPSVQ
jgi:hypothetical protein